jgi:hypothetical protein
MDIEHADAIERIELAAAEPHGLERLIAGDTPDAIAVAGHLAGCPDCAAELVRIRRVAALAREVVASAPDPALRERTLALVRAVGRDRSGEASSPALVVAAAGGRAPARIQGRRRSALVWAAAAAAVVVVGVGAFAAGGALRSDPGAGRDAAVALLSNTTTTTMHIENQPDARRVTLVSAGSGPGTVAATSATGTLLFSPTTGELVVVATGLPHEAASQEYGCWVEVGGERRRLGKMYWGGDIAAWAGSAAGLADLPAGSLFGVSLGPAGGGPDAVPVLTGRL